MSKPKPIIASDTLKSVAKYEGWLEVGNTPGSRNDSFKVNDIKHYNIVVTYFQIFQTYAYFTFFWAF